MKRFAKKIDHIFWLIVKLLPLFVLLLYVIYAGIILPSLFEFDHELADVVIALGNFYEIFAEFRFPFIYNMLIEIFDPLTFNFSYVLVDYISYVASVELLHVFFDVIVFVPRLCHKFMEGFYHND